MGKKGQNLYEDPEGTRQLQCKEHSTFWKERFIVLDYNSMSKFHTV